MAEANFKWERAVAVAVDAEAPVVAGQVAVAVAEPPLDAAPPATAPQLWRPVWIPMLLLLRPCRVGLLLLRAHKEEPAVGAAALKPRTPDWFCPRLVRRGDGVISWLHGTPLLRRKHGGDLRIPVRALPVECWQPRGISFLRIWRTVCSPSRRIPENRFWIWRPDSAGRDRQ